MNFHVKPGNHDENLYDFREHLSKARIFKAEKKKDSVSHCTSLKKVKCGHFTR